MLSSARLERSSRDQKGNMARRKPHGQNTGKHRGKSSVKNELKEYATSTFGAKKDTNEINAKSQHTERHGGFGDTAVGIMPLKSLNR